MGYNWQIIDISLLIYKLWLDMLSHLLFIKENNKFCLRKTWLLAENLEAKYIGIFIKNVM